MWKTLGQQSLRQTGISIYELTALLCAGISICVFFAVRVLTLNTEMLNLDEAHWAACAARVIEESSYALINCRDNKPPGVFWLYEIAFRLTSIYEMRTVRIVVTLWIIVSSAILFLTLRKAVPVFAALIGVSLFLLAMSVHSAMIAAKTEVVATIPVAAMMLALTYACVRPNNYLLALSGCLATLSFLCKQPTALFAGVGLLVVALATKERTLLLASFLSGVAFPIAVLAIFYSFFDGLEALKWQLWDSGKIYVTMDRITTFRRMLRVVTYTEEYSRLFPILAMLAAFGLLTMGLFLIKAKKWESSHRIALVWAGFGVVGFVCVTAGADLYLNYYILALPGAVLLASWGLARVHSDGATIASPIALPACMVLLMCFLMGAVLSLKEPVKSLSVEHQDRPVVKRIKELSSQKDRMYVWGYSPDLYLSSKRIPASRYVLTDMLVGFFGEGARKVDARERRALAEPGSWDKFLFEITSARPMLFVDASDSDLFGSGSFALNNYPDLSQWLAKEYEYDSTFSEGGGSKVMKIYRRKI